jgi:CheY-like chemotaxis protein
MIGESAKGELSERTQTLVGMARAALDRGQCGGAGRARPPTVLAPASYMVHCWCRARIQRNIKQSGMRVFLVEDNPRMRAQLQEALATIPGVTVVHTAATATEAEHWLQSNAQAWDLTVVDLFLAAGHGFQVLRSCRQRARQQRAVVLSNYTRDPVREHARLAGADAVFDKSFEIEALLDYCRGRAGEPV